MVPPARSSTASTHTRVSTHVRAGNTPLLIAVMLGHQECVKVLIDNGADVMTPGGGTWPPVAEAVSLGDRAIGACVCHAVAFAPANVRRAFY